MPTQQILATEEMVGAGHPTKADTLNRLVNLFAAKGDLLRGSAAATAAKLAIGLANQKLFVNAAGDDIEWASGIKIGTLSIDMATASADADYTGIGFKPSQIEFIAALAASGPETSIGFDDGSSRYNIQNLHAQSAAAWYWDSTYSIFAVVGSGVYYKGKIKTFNSDGFTITWVRTNAPTGTLNVAYRAFR